MKNLEYNELICINGGCASSNDPDVQAGMNIGCVIGRVAGATIRNFTDLIKGFNPFK